MNDKFLEHLDEDREELKDQIMEENKKKKRGPKAKNSEKKEVMHEAFVTKVLEDIQTDDSVIVKKPKQLTQDGFGLATKVKEITRYVYITWVYKLSHFYKDNEYVIVFHGKSPSGPPSTTVFASNKYGDIKDNAPLIELPNTSVVDTFKKMGYVVGK